MKIVHALSHGVTGGIGVKAAIDGEALRDQGRKPRWVWSGASGGKTAVVWIAGMATEGVDGGLAEDDRVVGCRGDPKAATVFAGTRS
jgi:hypothetical protein